MRHACRSAGAALLALAAASPAFALDRAVVIDNGQAGGKAIPAAPESRANNPSGLTLQILPGDEVETGTKLSFRISTERPGYLVLVDVDASGKLSQIYPNTLSLAQPEGTKPEANRIAPGKPVTIPSVADAGTYQFVASPPTGTGMLVAILSDKPVQMVDLPDVPAALAGQRSAVDYVRENTQTLRILPTEATGKVTEPKWSFATKFYQIR